MLGVEAPGPERLVYTGFCLEKRIRKNHPLRQVARVIDFSFIYDEVADKYGRKGHVSVPPPIVLKLMLLLVLYNVRSERELMDSLPERLDWLWFLGFDLDTPIPNHSVLSKARKRWGVDVFRRVFERVLWQCAQAGLVNGDKIFVDSTYVRANASNSTIIDRESLKYSVSKHFAGLEKRLEVEKGDDAPQKDTRVVNRRYVSTTDPDAAIVRQGKAKLYYKTHRAVDARAEIITATEVTRGDVNEAHRLSPLLDMHQLNTERRAEVVVADSKYGTIENFLECSDRGVAAHIPDLGKVSEKRQQRRGRFTDKEFTYDAATDSYRCPAGESLTYKAFREKRQSIDYAIKNGACTECKLKQQCTENADGRTIKRHPRQVELDRMRARSGSAPAKANIQLRQHLMERSFAQGQRYGIARSRWRGLWRVQIQEYLIATMQNIDKLVRYGRYDKPRNINSMTIVATQNCRNAVRPMGLASVGRTISIVSASFLDVALN